MATHDWQFPRGIGALATNETQPYMILTSYESKNAIESVGQTYKTVDAKGNTITEAFTGNPKSSIALYIPPNSLRQTTTSNWGGMEGGALRAAAGGALAKLTGMGELMGGSAADIIDAGGIGEVLGNIFTSAGMGTTAKAAAILDKQTGMLSAGAGIAVNNHMAMTYKGPGEFRTHEFAFNFFPKNAPDALEIQSIINDFQNGMLPRTMGISMKAGRTLSSPFFQSPRHWNIEFYMGSGEKNGFLFNIAKSVITSMTVNHDPNSTVSLHSDGSPVQTAFSLTFQEIELPTSSDTVTERTADQKKILLQQQTKIKNEEAQNAREMARFGVSTTTTGSSSDFRLKDNITLLQEEGFGIPNIYSFKYKWDAETTWIGVMAQELLDTGYSDAVGTDSEGFYWVDYSRLGFPMIGIK